MSNSNKSIGRNPLVPTFILLFALMSATSSAAALNTKVAIGPNVVASPKTVTLLDPNPKLIDKDGNLIQNVNLPSNLIRPIGTIADGVSKLIFEVTHKDFLNFSIVGMNPKDLSEGTLSPLIASRGIEKPTSSIVVDPHPTKNGTLVVMAVYTPPDSINETTADHKNITVSINDPNNHSVSFPPVNIGLYHPPVVLVHGLWEKSTFWEHPLSNFSQLLSNAHFDVTSADYGKHNAATFDPYANKTFGNYGINATRYAIQTALKNYHKNDIAGSQVDIVAHSVGGLIARGFVQQPDYNNTANYMKGYIHRLITIGTPHFGGHLSGPLFNHRNDWYCSVPFPKIAIFPNGCQFNLGITQLKTIYKNLSTPIDQGGVEALIPGSIAYSHLCPTNVKSYAIVGSWGPLGNASMKQLQSFFRNITNNPSFNLDRDGFKGNFQGNNDLQVNLTSQAGGLHTVFPLPTNSKQNDLPPESVGYFNIIHAPIFIAQSDKNLVHAELASTQIENGVLQLLNSNDSKFANSIGLGAPCDIPKK